MTNDYSTAKANIAPDKRRSRFVIAMQREFVAAGIEPSRAFDHARQALAEFLAEEGISYGDAAYDWSDDGAKILAADELETLGVCDALTLTRKVTI